MQLQYVLMFTYAFASPNRYFQLQTCILKRQLYFLQNGNQFAMTVNVAATKLQNEPVNKDDFAAFMATKREGS